MIEHVFVTFATSLRFVCRRATIIILRLEAGQEQYVGENEHRRHQELSPKTIPFRDEAAEQGPVIEPIPMIAMYGPKVFARPSFGHRRERIVDA
jgi:hypothetical protein